MSVFLADETIVLGEQTFIKKNSLFYLAGGANFYKRKIGARES
jgi:hypothetical protein